MTGTVEKAVSEIKRGKRYPIYLLHGDEFLARQGTRAIIDALVPTDRQPISVEVVAEESDAGSLPMRLRTLPLLGGTKVVLVQDSKAFVSRQNLAGLIDRSLEAWQGGDSERAARLLLQVVAAAGEGERFLDGAARGALTDPEWERALARKSDAETERWLRDVAGYAVAHGMAVPEAGGGGPVGAYEEALTRGIPATATLILTAEVVDERRALFKKISGVGFVIDCGVRSGKLGETQMRPEKARETIRRLVESAGKTIQGDVLASIVDRTGFSVRLLESEVEKILLYAGDRPTITSRDVLEVLSNSREAGIFDLTNALSARDLGRALVAVRSLIGQREPLPAVLGMIAAEVRHLIVARSALDRHLHGVFEAGMGVETLQSRILPHLKRRIDQDDGSAAKLLEMHPFRAFNLLKAAARFSLPTLLRCLEAISETDLALKTSGHPEDLLMERLLIRICAGE